MFGVLLMAVLVCTICGTHAEIGPFVIGGEVVTDPTKYPFFVRIFWDKDFVCGGTLITPSTVITAAHCFPSSGYNNDSSLGFVIAGCVNPKQSPPAVRATAPATGEGDCVGSDIASVRIHTEFNRSWFYSNDIAVVTLATPLPIGKTINTVNLAINNYFDSGHCFLMGWGCTDVDPIPPYNNCSNNRHLFTLNVALLDVDRCDVLKTTIDDKRQFCAGNLDGGSPCIKDSGGPLLCASAIKNLYWQVGIISYGPINCDGKSAPAVFTTLDSYRKWVWSTASHVQAPVWALFLLPMFNFFLFVINNS